MITNNLTCVICFENSTSKISCESGHAIGSCCIADFLSQYAFQQTFALLNSCCSIICPKEDCNLVLDIICIYELANFSARVRLLSVAHDSILRAETRKKDAIEKLQATILECLTLKCPCCNLGVDPHPDGCSAIRCIGCGNWYCNYCFEGFSADNNEINKSTAHSHTATHYSDQISGEANPFLPKELIDIGHKDYTKRMIIKCLRNALSIISTEFTRHDVSIALLLCNKDIEHDVVELWKLVNQNIPILDLTGPNTSIVTTALPATILPNIPVIENNQQTAQSILSNRLALAIKTINEEAITQILTTIRNNNGININYYDEETGHSLTSLALFYRNMNLTKRLVDMRPDYSIFSREGKNLLYYAVEIGTAELLLHILNTIPNIDLNQPVCNNISLLRPIHVSVMFDRADMLPILITNGANLELYEEETGHTPLTLALCMSNQFAASLLLQAGADVNKPDRDGCSPLGQAASKGLAEILDEMVTTYHIDINEKNLGYYPINSAINQKHYHLIPRMASLGANLDVIVSDQIFSLLMYYIFQLDVTAVLELIRNGANIHTKLDAANYHRNTMFVAVEKGLVEVVHALVVAGMDVNALTASSYDQPRAIHVAVVYNQLPIIRLLILLKANINIPDASNGDTPLHLAIEKEDLAIISILLKAGADPTIPNTLGKCCWYIAAEKANTDILRMIFTEGINITINEHSHRGMFHWTALHVLAKLNKSECIWMLCKLGAKMTKDTLDRTPLDIAIENKSYAAIETLKLIFSRTDGSSIILPIANQNQRNISPQARALVTSTSEPAIALEPEPTIARQENCALS